MTNRTIARAFRSHMNAITGHEKQIYTSVSRLQSILLTIGTDLKICQLIPKVQLIVENPNYVLAHTGFNSL